VPASFAELSPVDRVFTRIGASDMLQEGKSTFYIEMEETLNIVKHGSKHSIAILDELGRGTSTFDGLAIAYSVLKYIHNHIKYSKLKFQM
jgi:DNA mismatch repair ATPase MutS